jgi:hypothetical protein
MTLHVTFPSRFARVRWFAVLCVSLAALPAWPLTEIAVEPPVPTGAAQTGDNRTTVVIRRAPYGIATEPALPAAAQAVLSDLEKEQAAARAALEARLAERRAAAVARLEQLAAERQQANAPQEAQAIRAAIARLQESSRPPLNVLPDPGNLTAYRDRVGKRFYFDVTGSVAGTIWGSGIYTDDSSLATAAVHSGVLQPGQRGVVRVTILPGLESYDGSTRHGVTSYPYAEWQGSYIVEPLPEPAPVNTAPLLPPGVGGLPLPDPGRLTEFRDHRRETLTFEVVGSTDAGTIWGGDDDIYTDDSPLAVAAVHAGVLRPGQRGVVRVTILPGRYKYAAVERNGIASAAWNQSFPGSYRIEKDEPRSSGAVRQELETTNNPVLPR